MINTLRNTIKERIDQEKLLLAHYQRNGVGYAIRYCKGSISAFEEVLTMLKKQDQDKLPLFPEAQ